MFFVLIGIIILFVSFAIALFSLIREQEERGELSSPASASEGNAAGSAPAGQDVPSGPVLASGDNQDGLQQVANPAVSTSGEETFPWEVEAEDVSLAESLHNKAIINEVAIGSEGQGREMSGGFSVSDLRRKIG